MRASETEIKGVFIIEPSIFGDDRGFFFESFNARKFYESTGCESNFVQDNHSKSTEGVLRGLHYQLQPFAQGKLVRVIRGAILDVAVDLREHSPQFGKWVSETLSADNKKQLWIPEGFAHGFLTLSEEAEVIYKTTNYYSADHDRCIIWNDSTLSIDWMLGDKQPILSHKDARGKLFNEVNAFF